MGRVCFCKRFNKEVEKGSIRGCVGGAARLRANLDKKHKRSFWRNAISKVNRGAGEAVVCKKFDFMDGRGVSRLAADSRFGFC